MLDGISTERGVDGVTHKSEDKPNKGSAEWRKQRPLVTGVLDYFPDALLEVAYCSWVGNKQHHDGKGLHWDKNKSTDEADALGRHLMERGKKDTDGVRHSAKIAWRALALLQRELEEEDEVSARGPEAYPGDYGAALIGGPKDET